MLTEAEPLWIVAFAPLTAAEIEKAKAFGLEQATLADLVSELFVTWIRLRVNGVDLLNLPGIPSQPNPAQWRPLIETVEGMVYTMRLARKHGTYNLSSEYGGDIDIAVYDNTVSIRVNHRGYHVDAEYEETLEQFCRASTNIRHYLVDLFPELVNNKECGAWFRGESLTLS